jgi:hypothetical protein
VLDDTDESLPIPQKLNYFLQQIRVFRDTFQQICILQTIYPQKNGNTLLLKRFQAGDRSELRSKMS